MARQRRPYMAANKPKRSRPVTVSKSETHFAAPKGGRPSDYTEELGREICERLVKPESLRSICLNPAMPDKATVHRWLLRHSEFRTLYNHARSIQCDVYFDEITEIADDSSRDVDAEGKPNWEAPQRSRLRIDSRKWVCSKLRLEKYGERLAIAGDKENPLQVDNHTPLLPSEVADQFVHLLDKMELEMGLPVNPRLDAQSRVRAMLDAGTPVPPELYYAMHRRNTPETSQ